jgi:signal peptidase I
MPLRLRLLCLAPAIAVLVGCGGSSRSPRDEVRKTVDTYQRVVAEGDAAGICEQLSTAMQRQLVRAAAAGGAGKGTCTQLIAKGLKAAGRPAPTPQRVVAVQVRDARADATTEHRVGPFTSRTTVTLVREDGHWRIAAVGSPRTPDGQKLYRVPSESMLPTLEVGQWVKADLAAYRSRSPRVGDIVVFHPPTAAQTSDCADAGRDPAAACAGAGTAQDTATTFLKRIVAGPGDRVAILGGHVLRNGHPAAERFTKRCGQGTGCDFPKAITVPAGDYYLLGDNRGESDDSRFWGAVPAEWIIGKVAVS